MLRYVKSFSNNPQQTHHIWKCVSSPGLRRDDCFPVQQYEVKGESEQGDEPGGSGGTRTDPDPTQHPGQRGHPAFDWTQVSYI